MKPVVILSIAAVVCGAAGWHHQTVEPTVHLLRLPAGAIQPQVAKDDNGVVHVVYFSGDAANGDVFYARVTGDELSAPVRVNSEPGSAIATGTIRGARIAIGRKGRVHVAWNGSGRATPKGGPTPMLYARMNDTGTAFEAQRNLIQFATGIDGGGAIAADAGGRVFVAWHAGGSESNREGDRRVWLAASTDDGRTFSRERSISPAETGACGCCGMDGLIDGRGQLFFLYRSAREVVNRDSYLLASSDAGRTFRSVMLEHWNIGACPMSSYALGAGAGRVIAAWETAGQVQYADVTTSGTDKPAPVSPPGNTGARRHPSIAIGSRGEVLMSWSEGTGWQKGGSIAWQIFDRAGRPIGSPGRAPGLAVWSLSAAFAGPGNTFTIVY